MNPIETSGEITELAKALALAQAEMEGAEKGALNPHFGKKYADLTSVWDACRVPLSKHGLSVIQQPVTGDEGIGVVTTLLHQSGQWMRSTLWMKPERPGPQAAGSAITYARRFSLAAFVGVCPEDDDGEAAQGRDRDARPPGASWGKPKAVQAPKAEATSRSASTSAPAGTSNATSAARRPANDAPAASDTGEVLDPGQLADLTEAFDTKWGRGARTAAPSWLRAKFGTDDVASLTKVQATEALQALLAS